MISSAGHVVGVAVPLCVFFCSVLSAGETVFSEDFEKLNLTGLPQGWQVAMSDELSIVEDPPGNRVLKLVHKGPGTAELKIPLNIDQVRGRTIRVKVRLKCPTGFDPGPDKNNPNAPCILASYRSKEGQWRGRFTYVPPTHRDWADPDLPYPIPADATGAVVCLRVNKTACEAFFDNLVVTADGAPAIASAPSNTGGPPPMAGPRADVPQKIVEEHGAKMGPDAIAVMRVLRRPGAAANTYAVLGPAAPLKELEGGRVEQWTRIAVPKELTGPTATLENLFRNLPAFLIAKKPEIVILACGTMKDRKATYHERYDWEDLARLCLRFGAIPVLAVPSDKADCPSRQEMLEAIKSANLPAVEVSAAITAVQAAVAGQGVPSAFPQRVAWIFGLLERHVCGRTPAATDIATKAGGKLSGEVE